jgi:hypothetical protein
MTAVEFTQMPNCNLAESIHNKWLQTFGNKGGNLYVATVDDYIRAVLQVVAYHQFLNGGVGGDGPSKDKLKLRCAQCRAQRTGDPATLQKVHSTLKASTNYVLVVPTSRVSRFLTRRNASLTPPLVLTMRSTDMTSVYLGVWNYYKFTAPKVEKFFFCPDDIERCVKGSRRKWVDKFSADQKRPPIPLVWPVKIGTNLMRPEIVKLKNAGFQPPQKERITPTRLFNTSAPPWTSPE